MQCPTHGSQLVMSERAGIEIDYCPRCRGVWLDRGELDKIVERSNAQAAPPMQQQFPPGEIQGAAAATGPATTRTPPGRDASGRTGSATFLAKSSNHFAASLM